MSEIVRFKTDAGEEILVETGHEAFTTERIGRDDRGFVDAAATVDAALARSFPAIRRVADALRALTPDECGIEFGVTLNAEAGVVVAKTAAEGHFTVTLSWQRDASE